MQHPEDHDITALAYDLIEGPERKALLEHVAECDHCRAVYDNYRDEQVSVREAIVRDARSGAAEAKALESTLKMLGAIETETETKRGRLLRLSTWVLVAEVAAMLLIAVGLLFLIKPADEDASTEIIPVAKADRAPANIDEGVVYVRNTQGEWKQADAMPMDEWVMVGDAKPLSFTLANGSKTRLEPNAVFRIVLESSEGEPMVCLLHGDGTIDTRNVTGNLMLRAGDNSFLAMPGSRVSVECELPQADRNAPRAWSRPTYIGARVLDGGVVLSSPRPGFEVVPLRKGEKVEWTPEDFQLIEPDGNGPDWDINKLFVEAGPGQFESALRLRIQMLQPRLDELRKRIEDAPPSWNMQELRQQMQKLNQQLEADTTTTGDQVVIQENELVLMIGTDGGHVYMSIGDNTGGTVKYTADSAETLRAKLPEGYRERLDGVKFVKDAKGNYRIAQSHAEAHSESKDVKVKIIRRSESED